jgi:hypothetical protein
MSSTIRPNRWRSFRCHVVRLHYWQTMSNPDGERYHACAICRRERDTSFAAPITG